ncbi:MAG: hypothetical protein Q8O46_02040 [bacterium]|nr:hypothetical protein [bacterium]
MTQINIKQVRGLEDRLKKIEDRLKTLEELTPTNDKELGSLIIKTQEKGENTEK